MVHAIAPPGYDQKKPCSISNSVPPDWKTTIDYHAPIEMINVDTYTPNSEQTLKHSDFANKLVKQHAINNREPRPNTIIHFSSINYKKSLKRQLTPDVSLFDQGSDITYTCRRDLLTNLRQSTALCYFKTPKGRINYQL